MNWQKLFWPAIIFLIVVSFALSAFFYNQLPTMLPSHWNVHGQVNGYMPKNIALFIVPALILVFAALFILLPKIDPLRKNYKAFMLYFEGFIFLLVLFLFYIHSLIILAGLGYKINMNYCLVPAISVLFLYIALLMKKAKRNWFVGIRTPWTLSSDLVWKKTHALASKLFVLYAFLFLFVAFFPIFFWFAMLAVLLLVIALYAYSYFEYAKEKHKVRSLRN